MKKRIPYWLTIFAIGFGLTAFSQNAQQQARLLELAEQWRNESLTRKAEAVRVATEKGWPLRTEDENGRITELMRLNEKGMPVYFATDNAEGATVIHSSDLYLGGGAGLNLSGNGQTLGEWDGGGVFTTHQELTGRVTQMDAPASTNWHSTHVAGTLIASGAVAAAKGMSYDANLSAYDWDDDDSEMATEAAGGMKVSQHSYGLITGWYNNGVNWYWYGNTSLSETEDYSWGFYDSYANAWDVIAHNAPNYLIVKSAGNDRGEGPAPGTNHFYWNGSAWTASTTVRDLDGGASGYDCIGHRGVGKNLLTVGAVTAAGAMSSFSGWGPTDDGRIKPDIVAKGVSVLSSHSAGIDQYAYSNGTSMSGPMVSGSIGLLLEHQENLHTGVALRSATIKGLIMHTGDDLGNAGPDYVYGWGMMNTAAAAEIMTDQAASPVHIYENTLNDGQSLSMQVKATGSEPLKATIIWNDVPGTPVAAALDPTNLMLVNDLDLRLTAPNGTISYPYILDPANPATAATTGDNFRDNVEVIYIASPVANGIYDLQITHKGSLSGGSQNYTLIVTGNEDFDYTYLFNAADEAANYGGSWTNGSNQGNGFGAWTLSSGTNGGFSGHFIGDPTSAGVSGLPNPSFGMYANPGDNGNFATADRSLVGPLSIGSTLSFDWGVNWDSDGIGNKGINLYVGGTSGTQIININMGGSAAITINGNPMFNNYGTNAMTLNFEYVSAGNLRVYATGRDGVETYDQTIAVIGAPDAIRFYASGLASGDNRQPYFNSFTITSNFNNTPANIDAVAVGDLIFDADLVLDNLTIEAANSVTVQPTKNLTVNAVVDNQAGNTGLILQSNVSGTASMLHNSDNIDITIQRYLTGDANTANRKYHTVSVPLTASSNPLSGLFTGSYLYTFDQATQAYVSNGTSTTTPLNVDEGYLVYYPGANITFSFAGKANNGAFATAVSYPGVGNNFNLVPNPYPSAIDWDAASGWTKTNVNDAIYIYNAASSNSSSFVWADYIAGAGTNGGTRYIPAGQAFFVRTNAAAPVLSMNNDVRVHSAQAFYKNPESQTELLRIHSSNNIATDEIVVRFKPEATYDFDGAWDAMKLMGGDAVPKVYSMTPDQTLMSINSIPYNTESYDLPLGFESETEGEVIFSFEGIESFGDWVTILFEDQLIGQISDIRSNPVYTFTHTASNTPERFVLHFMGVTATAEQLALQQEFSSWSTDGSVYVRANNEAQDATVELFDLQGRLLRSKQLNGVNTLKFTGLMSDAVVLVRLTTATASSTQKVFIR